MITVYQLDDFDEHQGEDATTLDVRERCPEPAVISYPRLKIPLPTKEFDFASFEEPTMMRIKTMEFEKVMMGYGTTTFYVWKSLKDGKVYF